MKVSDLGVSGSILLNERDQSGAHVINGPIDVVMLKGMPFIGWQLFGTGIIDSILLVERSAILRVKPVAIMGTSGN